MNPWQQMPMSSEQGPPQGGMGNIMAGVPEHKQENMVDELLHNYVLMPQMAQKREEMKQMLLQQYMGAPNVG